MDDGRADDVMRTPEDVLGPLEAAIMRCLWARGDATVAAIHEDLSKAGPRHYAYTTVMTVLDRLHSKGLVTRSQERRRHVYRAAMNEDGLVRHVGARAADAAIARYGAAALRQFAVRLDGLDPALRDHLLELARRPEVDSER